MCFNTRIADVCMPTKQCHDCYKSIKNTLIVASQSNNGYHRIPKTESRKNNYILFMFTCFNFKVELTSLLIERKQFYDLYSIKYN